MDVAVLDWLIYRLRYKVLQSGDNAIVFIESLTSSSVKWVGLFVTALVGLYTIEDLWEKFGDMKMSVVSTHTHAKAELH